MPPAAEAIPLSKPPRGAYEDVIQLFGWSERTFTPTMFGSWGPCLAKHPSFRNDPRVKLYPRWAQEAIVGNDVTAAVGATYAGSLKMVKDVFEAGALATAGTDTLMAPNLHSELDAYVMAGLTPFQTLQTATVNSAKDLNLDAGTLEPGKLADIVLIQGDPRVNISDV